MKSEKEMYQKWLRNTEENIDQDKEELQKLEDEKDSFERYKKLQHESIAKWINDGDVSPELKDELTHVKDVLYKSISDNSKKIERLEKTIKEQEFIRKKIEEELNK